jgi:hypothetical protein
VCGKTARKVAKGGLVAVALLPRQGPVTKLCQCRSPLPRASNPAGVGGFALTKGIELVVQ